MSYSLKSIKPKIASICQDEKTIIAAFIFGSYAKGTENSQRDLDIALLLDKSRSDIFSQLHFNTILVKALGLSVDVVILNTAGEVLKYEIRRDGLLVFERSTKERKDFEVRGRKHFSNIKLHRSKIFMEFGPMGEWGNGYRRILNGCTTDSQKRYCRLKAKGAD